MYKGIYRIGDKCVGTGFVDAHKDFNGMKCTITVGFDTYKTTYYNTDIPAIFPDSYEVLWENGVATIVAEKHLRLQRAPEPLSNWKILEFILKNG